MILTLTTFVFAQTKTNDAIEIQIKTLKVEKTITLSYDEQGETSKVFVIGEDFGREQNKRDGLNDSVSEWHFFIRAKP